MTSESSDWDEDLPADPEEEYQTFVRTLERTEGFRLLFVRCTPEEGEHLIARVKEELPQKRIEVLRLDKQIDNLYEIVERLPNREQINILFIQGLGHSLSQYDDRYSGWNGVQRILNHLNQQRERFRDNFNICFVFILRLFAIQYFIRRAPDFFDWRSGVFELSKKYREYREFFGNKILFKELDGAVDQQAELLIQQGDILMAINEHEEAFDRYKKALDLTSENYNSWNNRGKKLYESHNYQAAIDCYDQALEIKLDFYEAWNNRGNALFNLGRLEEAIASYDQALKIKHDYYEAWDNRGIVLLDLRRLEEAIASFDKALKIKLEDHEAWYNRGNALKDLGRLEEAIASFDKALKIKPDDRKASYNRSKALVAYLDKALKIKPDDHEAWYNRGIALKDLGRIEEAIASYDQALKIKPDLHEAWYNKACSYALQGKVAQAIENLQQAINLSPEKYREMARTDSDFDSIREDDRFQALIL